MNSAQLRYAWNMCEEFAPFILQSPFPIAIESWNSLTRRPCAHQHQRGRVVLQGTGLDHGFIHQGHIIHVFTIREIGLKNPSGFLTPLNRYVTTARGPQNIQCNSKRPNPIKKPYAEHLAEFNLFWEITPDLTQTSRHPVRAHSPWNANSTTASWCITGPWPRCQRVIRSSWKPTGSALWIWASLPSLLLGAILFGVGSGAPFP